jgi:uncharacterized protein YjbJ (UPF0337 family)
MWIPDAAPEESTPERVVAPTPRDWPGSMRGRQAQSVGRVDEGGIEVDDGKRLQFEGKWDQMKGRVRESWGALTDDDLDRTQGKWDQVVGLIKEKTGENAEEIERRLQDMMD